MPACCGRKSWEQDWAGHVEDKNLRRKCVRGCYVHNKPRNKDYTWCQVSWQKPVPRWRAVGSKGIHGSIYSQGRIPVQMVFRSQQAHWHIPGMCGWACYRQWCLRPSGWEMAWRFWDRRLPHSRDRHRHKAKERRLHWFCSWLPAMAVVLQQDFHRRRPDP